MRWLLTPGSGPSRALVVLWALGAGWVMGAVTVGRFVEDETLAALALGGVTALLCALAAFAGTLPEKPWVGALVSLLASIHVSLVCAPLTWCALSALAALGVNVAHFGSVDFGVGILIVVTVIGVMVAAPLGLMTGIAMAVMGGLQSLLRARPSLISGDLGLLLAGLGSVPAAFAAYVAGASDPWTLDASLFEATNPEALLLAVVIAALGLALAGLAALTLLSRVAALTAIRRGRVEGFSITPARYEDEGLPRAIPWGPTDGVLTYDEALDDSGPYREGSTARGLLRVPL